MFVFDFCFPKAAEVVRSRELQNDRLTFQRISRVCRYDEFLIDRNKRVSVNFFISNTFLAVASNATRCAIFSIVELNRSIKKITNKNKRKC